MEEGTGGGRDGWRRGQVEEEMDGGETGGGGDELWRRQKEEETGGGGHGWRKGRVEEGQVEEEPERMRWVEERRHLDLT